MSATNLAKHIAANIRPILTDAELAVLCEHGWCHKALILERRWAVAIASFVVAGDFAGIEESPRIKELRVAASRLVEAPKQFDTDSI